MEIQATFTLLLPGFLHRLFEGFFWVLKNYDLHCFYIVASGKQKVEQGRRYWRSSLLEVIMAGCHQCRLAEIRPSFEIDDRLS